MESVSASRTKIKEFPFHIVAIGASLGGLDAIIELLKNIPSNTGMAYIIVQHLSPNHKSFLSSILSKNTAMKVQEIENMEHMEPDNVYVIPNDKIIEVIDGHIKLLPRPYNGPILSIDVLFSSLALTHSSEVIGIVLSGNAKDGTEGVKAIKMGGGITFAQDDSALADSMPNSAINSGFIDYILSPQKIGEEITYLYQNKFQKRILKKSDSSKNNDKSQIDLNTIFELLLKETGVDFSHYKLPTIKRRINHKMQNIRINSLENYLNVLRKNKDEVVALYNELLINVTSFFRDLDAFEYLKTTVLPNLLNRKNQDESIRIWIPACSTGEEAYSIAMLIADLQESKQHKLLVQIFATDISENAIRDARLGEYLIKELKDVPVYYINRFFVKKGDKYCVNKELREMCVFAPQNILRDPPFSRMDFISCCNLLIYFDLTAQKKVFSTFHFALNENGYLMLGKAETIGTSSLLFNPMHEKFKIYSKNKSTSSRKKNELIPRFPRSNMSNKKVIQVTKNNTINTVGIESVIDAFLLSNYMPACAVINKNLEIIQFRGPISLFLCHPSGKASLNILKMAQPEFAFELRNAINKSIESKEAVKKTGIEIKIENVLHLMSFEVCPLKIEWEEPLILVVFNLQENIEPVNTFPKNTNQIETNLSVTDKRIIKLAEELNNTRAEMNNIIEAQEITYEELQAANEEIVSSNEEFQTLNEELETSKEEIEVTNEELISTNQELQMRNDLLIELQEYSEAIYATIHEPILILDNKFHVKSANLSFYKKFQTKSEDTEGILLFELGNKQWDIPSLRDLLTTILIKNNTFENFEVSSIFSGIGERVMLLNARLIIQKGNSEKLILLAIEDITEQSRFYIKENLVRKKAEEKFKGFLESAPDAIIISDEKGQIQLVNSQTEILFGYTRSEIIGENISLLIPFCFKTISETAKADFFKGAIIKSKMIDDDLFGQNKSGIKFPVEVSLSHLKTEDGILISTAIRDISEQKRISTELSAALLKAKKATEIAEDALKSKEQFLSNMSHEIRTPMNAIIGFTKVAMKTKLTAKQNEYLGAIKESGSALIVLIDDILDLAKVNAGKMTFEQKPFKLKSSISFIIHLFETKIQEKNLILVNVYDSHIPDFIVGDSVRLHQIIINLISNAVKFTSVGKIILEVNLLKEDLDSVTIEFKVIDSGIGIPADKLTSIFENFQQAYTSTSRFYGGTGLGLAIVKKLVEAQKGKIKVKSEPKIGSTFSFDLKFKKTSIQIEEDDDHVRLDFDLKEVKVLVVEDIALNQLLMKTILDDFDFECDIVENGKIAVEKIQKTKYDIVLMDLQMPKMNGFEATKYIRETLKLNIPIIALTADVTTVDVAKCMSIGMNDYIAKPVDEKLLYNKMVQLLKKHSLQSLSGNDNMPSSNVTDLSYLISRTKTNKVLMTEMISLFIEQTPPLIESMKKSIEDNNWGGLQSAVHKIIPSFSIVGINSVFLELAKEVKLFAENKKNMIEIKEKVNELEFVCDKIYKELEQKMKEFDS
jgi:two-component system CheB/CheR fusion protein